MENHITAVKGASSPSGEFSEYCIFHWLGHQTLKKGFSRNSNTSKLVKGRRFFQPHYL